MTGPRILYLAKQPQWGGEETRSHGKWKVSLTWAPQEQGCREPWRSRGSTGREGDNVCGEGRVGGRRRATRGALHTAKKATGTGDVAWPDLWPVS